MSGYLADTSIFIALEQGRAMKASPPGAARISVVTLTELAVGVRMASSPEIARERTGTLADARRFVPLPYDEPVADRLAELLVALPPSTRRASVMDAIIAATALVHDLAVWTQDDDFTLFASAAPGLEVLHG